MVEVLARSRTRFTRRRAIESNLDLEIALTRLQEARTQELVVIGEALPASGRPEAADGTGTNLTVSRTSEFLRSAENAASLHRLAVAGGFDASWELTYSQVPT